MADAKKQIEEFLANTENWQRENLELFSKLVHKVEPQVEEDWKWSVPVFIKNGKLICAMSTFKKHTKFNFFNGAQLDDKHKLFNSGLDSKQHRSINLAEGEKINQEQLSDILKEAFEKL